MRLVACLLALAGLLCPSAAQADEDLHTEAAAALKRYYAERLRQPFIITDDAPRPKVSPPPWAEPLEQLAGGKPQERRRAAAYLRELLGQALQHEQSRTAPWRATPYWGGGAELPARDLRKKVADDLAKAGPLPDGLPVLRWYLDNESIHAFLEPIMVALGKIDGKDANALRAELALRPHDNMAVTVEAINQLTARKVTLPAERLALLCNHYRESVRKAARKLNAQQGGKDPGPFDSAKAMRSQPVRKLMEQLLVLIPELPPAKAEFVEVTIRYRDDKKVIKQTHTVRGWLVRRQGDTLEIYPPYGRSETLRHGERKQVKHYEPSRDGNGTLVSKIDITVEIAVAPLKVEQVVKEVQTARAKGTAGSDLSERGPLTGQFRGSGATLYEAILAAWLYRDGQDAQAASVLLPALDSLYADSQLLEIVRHQIGEMYGYRMLVAFAGDRDYDQALRNARLIDKRYPGTRFHEYAKKLAEQLPRRTDDFTKLKLPTPAEWADLKKKLTRVQQIDFLCERMRLLNCFQFGQPGGYFPDDSQYAEPCGMAPDASWGLKKGKTEVINPLTELQGPLNWFGEDKPRPKGMNLTLKDVPQLSKYLREDWYMLIVSFWRDFHPDRSLSSTRTQFAEIINGLAHKDICAIRSWDRLSPAEIGKEIERINRWAAANAEKSPVQLEWDALQKAVAKGEEWHTIEDRVQSLLKQDQVQVYDILQSYLKNSKTDAWSKTRIFQIYLDHDVTRAKDLAPKYLDAKDPTLRQHAALVVFRTGDKVRARNILGDGLASAEVDYWHTQAVEALLKDNSAESRRQVARLFANRSLPHDRASVRVDILRRAAQAGMKEPYRFYLPLLDIRQPVLPRIDDQGKESGASNFEPTVAEAYAAEIVENFAPNDPAIKEIVGKVPKPADRIPHLKKWLQARLATPKD